LALELRPARVQPVDVAAHHRHRGVELHQARRVRDHVGPRALRLQRRQLRLGLGDAPLDALPFVLLAERQLPPRGRGRRPRARRAAPPPPRPAAPPAAAPAPAHAPPCAGPATAPVPPPPPSPSRAWNARICVATWSRK